MSNNTITNSDLVNSNITSTLKRSNSKYKCTYIVYIVAIFLNTNDKTGYSSLNTPQFTIMRSFLAITSSFNRGAITILLVWLLKKLVVVFHLQATNMSVKAWKHIGNSGGVVNILWWLRDSLIYICRYI
jgi:hypothetical protein